MKITLISPYPDICCFGLRTMSSFLKQQGHHTKLIFLPDVYRENIPAGAARYDDHALNGIIPLCEDSDIIGITLMTNFFESAVQITNKIKSKLDKPVIWGGVHPTIRPEESLEYADIACVGEGEEAICELLNRMGKKEPYHDTKNMWFKKDGEIIRNSVRELIRNLSVYPAPDYCLDEQYLMHEGRVQQLSPDILKISLERSQISQYCDLRFGYQSMTSRGCPHKCTYCANDALKNLYGGKNYLRWRSVDHVINELLWAKQELPYITHIWFSDDSFFARKSADIEDFCTQYKDKINLPFSALASPLTLTEKKMELMVDAGMILIQMGIQTGSEKMLELYNRKQMARERTLKAAGIINKYKDKMLPPLYDFLLEGPDETDEDTMETIRFISRIPKPFHLQVFSLVLYPGTELYRKAKEDGRITDERTQVYGKRLKKPKPSYLNMVMLVLSHGKIPSGLLRFLVSRPMVAVFNNKFVEILAGCLLRLRGALKTAIRRVRHGS